MASRLDDYIGRRLKESAQIPQRHREQLGRLAELVEARIQAGDVGRLVFICTHNSRRSQMARVWALIAANYFSVSAIEASSAGTEATAVNVRAVAALQRSGCEINQRGDGDNPTYSVRISPTEQRLTLFSRDLSDPSLQHQPFIAVMTCSDADEACPHVPGASTRVALPYDDPKTADDTPEETDIYDECCRQISRDLLYLFSHITR